MRKGLRSAVLNRGRRSSAGDKEEQCYEGREGRGQDEAVLKRKKYITCIRRGNIQSCVTCKFSSILSYHVNFHSFVSSFHSSPVNHASLGY